MKKSKNTKTKIKLLRPEDVWQPHRGGAPGNSNARKTGLHTAEVRALRRRLRVFHARVKALVVEVDERLAKPRPTNATGPHNGDPATTP